MLIAKNASAQSTNYDRNSPAYRLMERLEIKSGNLNNGLFLDAAPISRENWQIFIDSNYYIKKDNPELNSSNIFSRKLTKADEYWLDYLNNDNLPWSDSSRASSKKPILRHFYKTKANLLEAHTKDFHVFINPVLGFEYGKEQGLDKKIFRNTRGFEIRGQISNKIGFYTYFTENQAGFPTYIQQYIKKNGSIPDVGLWKDFKKNYYDFLNSRAYITFTPVKNIHVQFGNDKNFIGSGFRSLLLSDFAKDYLQLKITTRVWRFQYQNIFSEMANYQGNKNVPYPKKYAAMHYLSFDAAKWMNFGVFEGIVFHDNENNGRGFDFNYLNPVIFYRSAEHNIGSPDNALLGANVNFLVAKHVKLYGQLMLDEFVLNQYRNNRNWWANKYALQAGFKWIDFLGLPNVDLQSEINVIRPYTYSADTIAKAYEHFKQPLAHPMGSNLREIVNILRVNTFGPLDIQLKYIITQQGLDTGKANLGDNIFLNNRTRFRDYGNELLQGLKTTTTFAEVTASYMLRHNLFIDANMILRTQKNALTTQNTTYYGAGLRLNFTKPDYTF
ncbi:MAG: hypothetical protein EOP53_04285 [Sphingobacteriales bacterium]|nr:MAG: hypothetical protein EOP53_04285 [Sphingobacteriales bacterium]